MIFLELIGLISIAIIGVFMFFSTLQCIKTNCYQIKAVEYVQGEEK